MGCAESTRTDDKSVAQNTDGTDISRIMIGTPQAASRPIGFSRVAEARQRLQEQEAKTRHDRDTIPPLFPSERPNNNAAEMGPAAGAPPNPLNVRTRPLVFHGDSTLSPMDSATSVFSSEEPPSADQQTVAFVNDDVLSQNSLASSVPVLSLNNSQSWSPDTSNVDGTKPCVSEEVSSPEMLPSNL